jgi:hypothetical protein
MRPEKHHLTPKRYAVKFNRLEACGMDPRHLQQKILASDCFNLEAVDDEDHLLGQRCKQRMLSASDR